MASATFQRLHKLRCLLIDVQGALPSEPVDLHQRIAQGLLDLDSLCSAEVSSHQLSPPSKVPQPDQATTSTASLPNSGHVAKSSDDAVVSSLHPEQKSIEATAKQCATALEAKEHATAAFKAQNYQAALALCNRAIELEPDEATHLSNRSLAHLRLGSYTEAQADAAAAVALKPAWGRAHYRLGAARRAREDLTGALASLTKAVELDPKDATSCRALNETQAALREATHVASASQAASDTQGRKLSMEQHDDIAATNSAALEAQADNDVEAEVVAAVAAAQREAAKEKAQRAEAEAERLREVTARRQAADLAHQKKAAEAAVHAVSASSASASKVEVQEELYLAGRTAAGAPSATVEPVAKTTPRAQPIVEAPAALGVPATAMKSTSTEKSHVSTSTATAALANANRSLSAESALEPCADGSFDLGDVDDVVLGKAAATPSDAANASSKQQSARHESAWQKKKKSPPLPSPPPPQQSVPTPLATPPVQDSPPGPPPTAAAASSAEVKKEWQGALPPLGQPLTPLGIVPAIQECLVRAATGGGGSSSGLSDDYVAVRFRGLDREMLEVAQRLLGSAVPHADSISGALPAKILSNMIRFVNLTLKHREEKRSKEAAAAAASGGENSKGGGASFAVTAGRNAAAAAVPKATTAGTHAPSFFRESNEKAVVDVVRRSVAAGDPILIETAAPVISSFADDDEATTTAVAAKPTSGNSSKNNKKNKKKRDDNNGKSGGGGQAAERRALQQRLYEAAQGLSTALEAHGCAVCDRFLSPGHVARVRQEVARLAPHYESSEIWVGKDADVGAQLTVPRVRGDKVLWVDSASVAASSMTATESMLKAMDQLVLGELKKRVPRLAKIKDRTDPMLAVYPGGGARFQKHVDNTARDGRRLTVLVYLNPSWDASTNGGELVVHETDATSGQPTGAAAQVPPSAGRLALFWSDRVPHEVLPAHAERHAVTLWYYDADERQSALDKGSANIPGAPQPISERQGPGGDRNPSRREERSGNGKGKGKGKGTTGSAADPENDPAAHLRSRHEARAFLLWILGSDKVATQADVEAIAQRGLKLSPHAVRIVAGVVGAPSPEDCMEALGRLTPATLQQLREDLSTMGVGNLD